ncbi:hypothetical protein LBMAG18_04780 [Alphaproteobacteria bacterium]|nr:hypothetical protein LBMAG18_04780 [Alphaproteobacteria bacterium]
MSYIIISNIGLAVMMLVVFLRYSHFRLNYKKDLEKQKKIYDQQIAELKKTEVVVDTESLKAETQKNENLTREIQELERQRDSDLKLRISAEKQIEVTNKKMQELQKRIEDWSVIQDSILNDTRDTMVKIGNDLFKKLNDSYKQEALTNRNLIGRVSKTQDEQKEFLNHFGQSVTQQISSFQQKISSSSIANNSSSNQVLNGVTSLASVNNNQNNSNSSQPQNNSVKADNLSDVKTKKLLEDIVETMKAAGRLSNKDYFLATNFDDQRAKLMLCELVFAAADRCYVMDFKAIKIFNEYEKLLPANQQQAQDFLKDKFSKYLAYLANPKYIESIDKVLKSARVAKEKNVIILALSSKKEIGIIKDLGIYDQVKKFNIEVMDFDLIVNVVI